MAEIKEWDTDKTQKLKLSENWKPKFGLNPKNQVKKKNYFWQTVFELEQLDISTNDAI